MAATFKFELVSPERILMASEAEQVIVPGAEGLFTVLPDHAPVISTLAPGVIQVTTPDAKKGIFVQSGFADVSGNSLTILAERAFIVDEVDTRHIEQELDAAQKAMESADSDEARYFIGRAIDELKVLHAQAA